MANEESGNPLRRWRPFYGTFGVIDDAVEASGHPRAAFRDIRVRIVKLLRAATDDGVAEQLCAALDQAMVESLQTLRVVPVQRGAPASTDLVRAVGALGNHGSARIHALARDVVRRGTVAVDDGGAAAVKEELGKLSGDRIPRRQSIPVKMGTVAATEEHKKKVYVPPTKIASNKQKTNETEKLIVAHQSDKLEAKKVVEKMEATKRKLHEGYQEAEKLKRQHTIKKINDREAPKLLEQRERKMRRGPARCQTSVARSLLPSLQLI